MQNSGKNSVRDMDVQHKNFGITEIEDNTSSKRMVRKLLLDTEENQSYNHEQKIVQANEMNFEDNDLQSVTESKCF